jgi:hypothetical protein
MFFGSRREMAKRRGSAGQIAREMERLTDEPNFCLTKSETSATDIRIVGIRALACSGREEPRLFEIFRRTTPARAQDREGFFYFFRRNPLKSHDSEK